MSRENLMLVKGKERETFSFLEERNVLVTMCIVCIVACKHGRMV